VLTTISTLVQRWQCKSWWWWGWYISENENINSSFHSVLLCVVWCL